MTPLMTPFWHNQEPYIRDLVEHGATIAALCVQYDCAESYMKRVLRSLGISMPRKRKACIPDRNTASECSQARWHMDKHKLKYTDMERVYD